MYSGGLSHHRGGGGVNSKTGFDFLEPELVYEEMISQNHLLREECIFIILSKLFHWKVRKVISDNFIILENFIKIGS